MLSNKWTFSLTYLVMVLAIGLVMTPAFGHDTKGTFAVTFTPGELMDDVSTVDHADITDIQVESGRNRASAYPFPIPASPIDGTPGIGPTLSFSIDFAKVVQLHDVSGDNVTPSGNALGLDDFTVDAYDDLFRSLGTLSLLGPDGKTGGVGLVNSADDLAVLKFKTPRITQIQDPGELPGRQFTLTIDNSTLQNAYNEATGGAFEIHYLLITLNHAAAADASLATRQAQRLSDPTVKAEDLFTAEHSNGPHFIRVDLVEKDEGDPQYQKIVSGSLVPVLATSTGNAPNAATDPGISGSPGVVAISKVIERSLVSAVETGPFDIRVMLTEQPAEFTAAHIRVVNGSAGEPKALLPIPVIPNTASNPPKVRWILTDLAAEVGLNYIGTEDACECRGAVSLNPLAEIPHTISMP